MESIGLQYVRGRISTQEYWALTLPSISFAEQCDGYPSGEDQLLDALKNGFIRLDQLDRSDFFWRNSNNLPNLGKLYEFACYQIQQRRDLVESAWLAIAMALHNGSEHLIPEWWGILRDAGKVDADFLVVTSWNSSPYWTDENIIQLSDLVRELKIQMEVEEPLHKLSLFGKMQKQWSNAVLDNIKVSQQVDR